MLIPYGYDIQVANRSSKRVRTEATKLDNFIKKIVKSYINSKYLPSYYNALLMSSQLWFSSRYGKEIYVLAICAWIDKGIFFRECLDSNYDKNATFDILHRTPRLELGFRKHDSNNASFPQSTDEPITPLNWHWLSTRRELIIMQSSHKYPRVNESHAPRFLSISQSKIPTISDCSTGKRMSPHQPGHLILVQPFAFEGGDPSWGQSLEELSRPLLLLRLLPPAPLQSFDRHEQSLLLNYTHLER